MPDSIKTIARLAAPLAVALAAVLLATRFLAPGVDVEAMTRGPLGPVTWPKAMLVCLIACASALFLLRLWQWKTAASTDHAPGGEYSEGRGAAGIALLVAYAWALPEAGFALASAAFIAGWLALGGMRRPIAMGLTAAIGTVLLLYLFVKVSLMPLDRGKGVFEAATVALYRLLGIY